MKLSALPRLLCCFLLAALVLCLGGCVYFRLLQLKNQLGNFDENFAAVTTDGVTIVCLHPLLLSDDLRFLGIDPKTIKTNGQTTRWHVRWLKDEPPQAEAEALHDVELFMDLKDDKLQSLHIPERYFEFFPKDLFVDLLRSTGQASIDKLSHRAEVHAGQEMQETMAVLPALSSVEKLLGLPTEKKRDGELIRYRYRYRTETPTGRGKAIEMIFSFDQKTGNLRKLVGKLPKGTMSYEFPVETAEAHSVPPTPVPTDTKSSD